MAASRRKPMTILEEAKENALRMKMFAEYREENAKDMEREARGEW